MPHTNTIEALTLELDRVNDINIVTLEALKIAWRYCDPFAVPDEYVKFITQAIQKAESR